MACHPNDSSYASPLHMAHLVGLGSVNTLASSHAHTREVKLALVRAANAPDAFRLHRKTVDTASACRLICHAMCWRLLLAECPAAELYAIVLAHPSCSRFCVLVPLLLVK